MTDKDVTRVGPPVDEREDDGRKHDHGTAGPAPSGKKPYEHGEEVSNRLKFLADVRAKVVEAEEQPKPKTSSASTK